MINAIISAFKKSRPQKPRDPFVDRNNLHVIHADKYEVTYWVTKGKDVFNHPDPSLSDFMVIQLGGDAPGVVFHQSILGSMENFKASGMSDATRKQISDYVSMREEA